MENVIKLLASHVLPINVNKYSPGNIFTLVNKSIPKSFFAVLKKPSLSTSNPLKFIRGTYNRGNPSRNNIEGQSLINAFNKFDAKIISNIIFI